MKLKTLRFFAYFGIVLTMGLSAWYLMKTYQEGNPRWVFLILAIGIAVLLSQSVRRR